MIFFVPARKGSERVVGKNTRPLGGRPLIAWTFDCLVEARVDPRKVIVSSDDSEVIALAHDWGFRAFVRPPDLCTSSAKMNDVLFHHDQEFGDEDVMVLYPTSPFRRGLDVERALSAWEISGGPDKVLMSVERVMHRPYGLMRIHDERGELEMVLPQGMVYYRAQGQPSLYRANGAIYLVPSPVLKSKRLDPQLFGPSTIPHVMGTIPSFEVDTEDDLRVAEALMRTLRFEVAR